MMGHNYECTDCDFEFCSGWSHHAGGQFLVCPSCANHYILGDGESVWGPGEGETLQLIDREASNDKRTGVTCVACSHPDVENQEWDGVVRLQLEELRCPKCSAHESLKQEFRESAICPKCHVGKIERRGSCIY